MVVLNIIVMLLLALFVIWLLLNRSVSGRSPVLVSLGCPFTETACCPSPTWT